MEKLLKILLIIVLGMVMIKGFGELFYFNNVHVIEEVTYHENTRTENRL